MDDAVPDAVEAMLAGRIVAVVDDGRDATEVDLVAAGARLTTEIYRTLLELGSGQVHVPVEPARLDELEIPLMLEPETAGVTRLAGFTVTVDLGEQEPHPGSAPGQVGTIRGLADYSLGRAQFRKPGHVAPLRARAGGVLRRIGHTEAAVDLAGLAGLPRVAVLTPLLTEAGTSATELDAQRLLAGRGVPFVRISELIRHRRQTERVVFRVAEARLPTAAGEFAAIAFHDTTTEEDHLALVTGDLADGPPPLVRVHSECLTGDVFGSRRCDCGEQLQAALRRIQAEGRGVVLYMRQEGRGIGLANKLRAYGLQERGLDTVDANRHLGFAVDLRDYGVGAQILRDLGLRAIRLLTNNPKKTEGFESYGLTVVEQIPLTVPPGAHNARYLETKRTRMGHAL
ncbi:MAG: GTP cyclohydrolase II [Actinobacteria bacterium]|nr:GTP cyclohydrolase II [Actinomycetota bacterium]